MRALQPCVIPYRRKQSDCKKIIKHCFLSNKFTALADSFRDQVARGKQQWRTIFVSVKKAMDILCHIYNVVVGAGHRIPPLEATHYYC